MCRPSSRTAAAVSSQDVSIPRVRCAIIIAVSFQQFAERCSLLSACASFSKSLLDDLARLENLYRPLQLDVAVGIGPLTLTDLKSGVSLLFRDLLFLSFVRSLLAGLAVLITWAALRLCEGGPWRFHDDIRDQPGAVNRPPLRCEVLGCGQAEPGTVAQRNNRLHRPLPEGFGSQDHGSFPVLKRAGDDLGGTGGTPID